MDGPPARRIVGALPGESHRLPSRLRRPRPLRKTMSRLRHPDPAHRLLRKRNELLRPLPDRRQTPPRPRAIKTAAQRLAEADRGVGRRVGLAGFPPPRVRSFEGGWNAGV